MQIYNAVIHLIKNGKHNIGLYKRLCNCFNEVPFGEMSIQLDAALDEIDAKDYHKQAELLGIPLEMFPLDKQLPSVETALESWAGYFEGAGLKLDSPVAFILETPLSVAFAIYKYFVKFGQGKKQ